MEDLDNAQKQLMEKAIKDYKRMCLQSFNTTTIGKVIQKTPLPVLRLITVTEDSVKFHDMFDHAMHHAMINQSNVVRNSMQNAIYY